MNVRNQSKNSLILTLSFLAGAAWANALPAEQAEAALRQNFEGAQARAVAPQAPVSPAGTNSAVQLAPIAPVPLQTSIKAPTKITQDSWTSGDEYYGEDYSISKGAGLCLKHLLLALVSPLIYPGYFGIRIGTLVALARKGSSPLPDACWTTLAALVGLIASPVMAVFHLISAFGSLVTGREIRIFEGMQL